jgi:hypothetical protein
MAEQWMRQRSWRVKARTVCFLEEAVRCPPINCHHNPSYAGSFIGNDCFMLIHDLPHLLLLLPDTTLCGYATQEEMDGVKYTFDRHICPLWESWERITTLMRSTEELLVEEENKLNIEIAVFDKLFDENTAAKNITIKMHHLFYHIIPVVHEYGTIGFFAEDGLELVHVVCTKYSRTFQTLKVDKKGGCIIKSKAFHDYLGHRPRSLSKCLERLLETQRRSRSGMFEQCGVPLWSKRRESDRGIKNKLL